MSFVELDDEARLWRTARIMGLVQTGLQVRVAARGIRRTEVRQAAFREVREGRGAGRARGAERARRARSPGSRG